MKAKDLQPETDHKLVFRQTILRLAPGISSESLDCICKSINVNRRYFIKSTSSKQKFLNLVTRETIITKDTRAFSEVLPLYGVFKSPYFEKIGDQRFSIDGELETLRPAAAIKIRVGTENQRTSSTYSLIIYLAEDHIICTA